MPRRFEYTDAKSNKFWEIEVSGKSFTVHYGRIGTDGQTQKKTLASPAAAQAEAEKHIAEKLRKGYHEVGGAAARGASGAKTAKPATKNAAKATSKSPAKRAAASKAKAVEMMRLFAENNLDAFQQGIALLRALEDREVAAVVAKGVSIKKDGSLIIPAGSDVHDHVFEDFRTDVAFWALRGAGRLADVRTLQVGGCLTLTNCDPLRDLTSLEDLSLSGCTALTSLDGIQRLTALRCLDLTDCWALTSLEGIQSLTALKELRPHGCRGLNSLDGLPVGVKLSGTDGELALDGLTSLSDAVAASLVNCGCNLSLRSVTALSPAATAAFAATHVGELRLVGVTAPPNADEVLSKHEGRVYLGYAFDQISVGVYDAIETYGEKVEATELKIPVQGEVTFDLAYQDRPCLSEYVIGDLDDETVLGLLEGGFDFSWYDYAGILHRSGIESLADTLRVYYDDDDREHSIRLRHRPRSTDFEKLALKESARGAFIHISSEMCPRSDAVTYSLTFTGGVFDLARVRVDWNEEGVVSGYTYCGDDNVERPFEHEEVDDANGAEFSTSFYFNTGKKLVTIDFDELRDELETAEVDAKDLDAVRAHLLKHKT